jgi:hypothetical protein
MKNRIFNILIVAIFLLTSINVVPAQRKSSANLMDVKIFVGKEMEDLDKYDPENPFGLAPVRRRVDARSPLRNTLRVLTEGVTREEEKQKMFSATFGIKLLSVRLENGTAFAYFTMPEDATFSGDGSPFMFKQAVEKTALQFPQVKKVVVCLDGILDFGSESEDPPTKCPR